MISTARSLRRFYSRRAASPRAAPAPPGSRRAPPPRPPSSSPSTRPRLSTPPPPPPPPPPSSAASPRTSPAPRTSPSGGCSSSPLPFAFGAARTRRPSRTASWATLSPLQRQNNVIDLNSAFEVLTASPTRSLPSSASSAPGVRSRAEWRGVHPLVQVDDPVAVNELMLQRRVIEFMNEYSIMARDRQSPHMVSVDRTVVRWLRRVANFGRWRQPAKERREQQAKAREAREQRTAPMSAHHRMENQERMKRQQGGSSFTDITGAKRGRASGEGRSRTSGKLTSAVIEDWTTVDQDALFSDDEDDYGLEQDDDESSLFTGRFAAPKGKPSLAGNFLDTHLMGRLNSRPRPSRQSRQSRQSLKRKQREERREQARVARQRHVIVEDGVTMSVEELAEVMGLGIEPVQRALRRLGVQQTAPEVRLDADTVEMLAIEFDAKLTRIPSQERDRRPAPLPTSLDGHKARPPIITVMGHVDHGKTTLLDALRSSNLAEREAGGITQAMGAFSVELDDASLTFLDTPGHAAFTSMRSRGASVTDVVVLVVSAVDGVQPQTLEALEMAQEAELPVVVAMTKMDRPGADPEFVREQLAEHDLVAEEDGGDTLMVPISAVSGEGMKELKDAISLTAEMLDLRTEHSGMAEAWVIDSQSTPGAGTEFTVIVSRGELRVGDVFVCGTEFGRVRALIEPSAGGGRHVDRASPGVPVRVSGLQSVTGFDDELMVVEDEERAQEVVDVRKQRATLSEDAQAALAERDLRSERDEVAAQFDLSPQELNKLQKSPVHMHAMRRRQDVRHARMRRRLKRSMLRNKRRMISMGVVQSHEGAMSGQATDVEFDQSTSDKDSKARVFSVMLRADTTGSLEAMIDYISRLPRDVVKINVLRTDVGPATQEDVQLARFSGAEIVSFNSPAPPRIADRAQREGVKLRDFSIIYHFFDAIRDEVAFRMPRDENVTVLARAEVAKTFTLNEQANKAAGCKVTAGPLNLKHSLRVVRDGEEVFATDDPQQHVQLRVFKDVVTSVDKGHECGVSISSISEFQPGDIIEVFTTKNVLRTFDDASARGHATRRTGGQWADDQAKEEEERARARKEELLRTARI